MQFIKSLRFGNRNVLLPLCKQAGFSYMNELHFFRIQYCSGPAETPASQCHSWWNYMCTKSLKYCFRDTESNRWIEVVLAFRVGKKRCKDYTALLGPKWEDSMCGHPVLMSTLLWVHLWLTFWTLCIHLHSCKNQDKTMYSEFVKTVLVSFLCFPGTSNLLRDEAWCF